MKTKAKVFLIHLFVFAICCSCDPCKNVDCGPNGTCYDGTCVCDYGYTGASCAKCNGVTCRNGGICNKGICECEWPYVGKDCSWHYMEILPGPWREVEIWGNEITPLDDVMEINTIGYQFHVYNFSNRGEKLNGLLENQQFVIPEQSFIDFECGELTRISGNEGIITYENQKFILRITKWEYQKYCNGSFVGNLSSHTKKYIKI